MAGVWPRGFNVITIVPAYQEAGYIENVVRQLVQRKKEGLVQEIVVVDDGSTDRTAELAIKAGADKVIMLKRNQGKIAAFAAGVKDIAQRYAPKGRFRSRKARLKAERVRLRKMEKTIVINFDADLKAISGPQIRATVNPLVKNAGINMVVDVPAKWIGQRAIRLRALGGLLRNTKVWRLTLKTGYGQEAALNYFIKNSERSRAFFDSARPSLKGARGKILLEQTNSARDYLTQRNDLAESLRKERMQIKQTDMPKDVKQKYVKRVLADVRRRDREAASRMLKRINTAKKMHASSIPKARRR